MNRPDPIFWRGKRVFVTGHTGFKGGWLALWLNMLGAKLYGYALNPSTRHSFFESCSLSELFEADIRGDVGDLSLLRSSLEKSQPEVLFHLAAQPLVRESYLDPIKTFMTNTMGTAHVLNACRGCEALRALVLITTDKVYKNREWDHPYRENDRLGGHDPYSASKAAAELVADSFRKSFFFMPESLRIATVRAGNVIGGGDWSEGRLVPDCLRAFSNREPVVLRRPGALRPWQHVLEPLCGYLLLAEKKYSEKIDKFSHAFNFAPEADGHVSVEFVARELAKLWGEGASVVIGEQTVSDPYEAGSLKLEISLARSQLNWKPRWSVPDALSQTIQWHTSWLAGKNVRRTSMNQIDAYNRHL